jgi:hypothetical protein
MDGGVITFSWRGGRGEEVAEEPLVALFSPANNGKSSLIVGGVEALK